MEKTNLNAAIGVFDSGLGGLTAVKELKKILPNESIIYFGDTGRVPYGTRSPKTIKAYAAQDIAFLLSKGVKTILAACGTVSSVLNADDVSGLPVPYMGVLHAAAAAAAKATKNGIVGIIGTEATINSGAFQQNLAKIDDKFSFAAQACPLFVPLVENGHFAPNDELARLAAKEYLAPIKASGADTLILGCTHYPLLAQLIDNELEGKLSLIDSGREAAKELKKYLLNNRLAAQSTNKAEYEYYVSDEPNKFAHYAEIFLGEKACCIAEKINIESYNIGK